MFTIDSYIFAVIMCVVTMICWGSWANTQKLASKDWPSQLFYWDYVLGLLIISLIYAFTLGSNGGLGRGFIEDLNQASSDSLTSAFIGGIIFNFSNIFLVAALEILGMAVAFPVAIGLALALGVLTNYISSPNEYATLLLFSGVGFVIVAIIIDALAYNRLPSSDDSSKSFTKGLFLSIGAGVLAGNFYRFVAQSMSVVPTESIVMEAGKLSPYTAVVIFTLGIFISNFVLNTFIIYKPIVGKPTTYSTYFNQGSLKLHMIGVLGGFIWNTGMTFNIIASGVAGPAISFGLGQGATMVAAFWGVFIWKEFKDAPKGTNNMIAMMFIFFLFVLILIIASRQG